MKQQYIKKESLSFPYDESIFEEEPFQSEKQYQYPPGYYQHPSTTQQRRTSSSTSSKRQRQQETIDIRSPTNTPTHRKKKPDSRHFFQSTQGATFVEYILQKWKFRKISLL